MTFGWDPILHSTLGGLHIWRRDGGIFGWIDTGHEISRMHDLTDTTCQMGAPLWVGRALLLSCNCFFNVVI